MPDKAPTTNICGFDVTCLRMADATQEIVRMAKAGEGAWVALINLEMVSRARKDPEYAETLGAADMILADGMPIVWASGSLGTRLPERVAGVDLTRNLLDDSHALQVSIIGGEDPVSALATAGIKNTDRIQIDTGMVQATEEDVERLAASIRPHDPQIIFLALGVNKQDFLAVRLRKAFPKAIILGVGGSFELIGGQKRRAPQVMQRSGLEWLFRLLYEPRRLWRRYLLLYPTGALWVLREIARARRAKKN
jgi:N-acetylglucosaminyldiphosphoundecaprenol N-acetyl-beta-D-mannosaminyltransferase